MSRTPSLLHCQRPCISKSPRSAGVPPPCTSPVSRSRCRGSPHLPQIVEVAHHLECVTLKALVPEGSGSQVIIHRGVVGISVGPPLLPESWVAGVPPVKHRPSTVIGLHMPEAPHKVQQISRGYPRGFLRLVLRLALLLERCLDNTS